MGGPEEAADPRHRLVVDLSHDLRAPLLSVVTRAKRLAEDREVFEQDPHARRELREIQATALFALRLADELMNVVMTGHRQSTVALDDVDTGHLVTSVLDQFQPIAEDAGRQLVRHVPTGFVGRTDGDKLAAILSNLIANAIRHARSWVCCTVRISDQRLVLEVADDGPGVPVEDRETVFERTWRGRDSGRERLRRGWGIGLSIVSEFVGLLEGTVAVGTADAGGALFVVELPFPVATGSPSRRTVMQAASTELATELAVAALEADLEAEGPPQTT